MTTQDRFDPFVGVDDDYDARMSEAGKLKVVDDYSPEKFYCRSTNKFDHSQAVQVQFPKDIVAAIDTLVALRIIPEYTSRGAVLRDATVHRLHELAGLVGNWELGELLTLERAIAGQDARKAIRQRNRELLEAAAEELKGLANERDEEGLANELDNLEVIAETMNEFHGRKMHKLIAEYR
jgi:hypothetical protein